MSPSQPAAAAASTSTSASAASDPDEALGSALVAVATTPACPYCKRAKQALAEGGVAFVEVDVGGDEALRQLVRQITGQRTVPQLLSWLTAAGEPDPRTTALQLLSANLVAPAAAAPAMWGAGAAGAGAGEAAARALGGAVDATDATALMLVAEAPPPAAGQALNGHFQWQGPARPASEVAASLRGRILELYDTHLSGDGRSVSYGALRADPRFAAFVDATAELQKVEAGVDLSPLSRAELTAFGINLYNALVVHALVALRLTSMSAAQRATFYSRTWYAVDFGRNKRERLSYIASLLTEPARGRLEALLAGGGDVRVSYKEYDWSLNGTD
ncbi:hypothetical protein TSOC_007355 [Tetrabaena socialis]|uniref:Uncharacterized protein n=1 Tax=Tetrabaena socialis TaxID=47790 RepID=A0A2J8A194_9CHLO|nr:hypothetical protein TSOC_007355 [Tetrabaena socialis]|eukprot:PNH06292.1 hypothetical protein TSOC_007355 [Tetrabaena socialis]